jgi:hypothetical protein
MRNDADGDIEHSCIARNLWKIDRWHTEAEKSGT